jgi:hypothetical protein
LVDISTFSDTFVNMKADPAATAPCASYLIAMVDVLDFLRILERTRERVLPGHEAVNRDELLRALQRRLRDAHEHAPQIKNEVSCGTLRLLGCG